MLTLRGGEITPELAVRVQGLASSDVLEFLLLVPRR